MVYEKSARGYSEFINNQRTLSVRERQVLLLVNGIRNLDDLEKFFKKEQLTEILQKLEAGGFIQRFSTQGAAVNLDPATASHLNSAHSTSAVYSGSPAFFDTQSEIIPIDPITLDTIKTILLEATDDYLGLMGRAIRTRICNCQDAQELRNCISSWHMAMRESKLGRESTSFLMAQIHQTLENATLNAALESPARLATHAIV